MKSKQILIMAVILLLIICIAAISIIYLVVTSMWGEKVNSNTIIKKFEENEMLFEEVVKELSEKDDIYLDKKGEVISISIYEKIGDQVNSRKVKKEEFDQYGKTIDLMKKLNITYISKEKGNTSFLFNSMLELGQYIVKIQDEEKYKKDYDITHIMELKDNWYYIEIK